jgi:phospholipid transport system substrate-binding protein
MRTILILAAAGLLSLPVLIAAPAAFADPPSMPNMANTPEDAQKTQDGKFIQDLGNNAIANIQNSSLSQEERNDKYRELLNNAFDMKNIAHFVIGRAWDRAPPQQQQEYLDLFNKIVLKTYGDRLNLYSGENFQVTGVRPESDKDSIVSSQITHPDGSAPTKIDWRVRLKDGNKPMVEDVVVEGVSQSVTQRDEYSSIVQQDGGKLDNLLNLMRQQLQNNTQGG